MHLVFSGTVRQQVRKRRDSRRGRRSREESPRGRGGQGLEQERRVTQTFFIKIILKAHSD